MGACIFLMFWRAWHLRNDVIHGKGTRSITASTKFLTAYAESLQVGQQHSTTKSDVKGKDKVREGCPGINDPENRSRGKAKQEDWKPPRHGWVKINTDA
jgi:hypothetical protein